MGFLIKRVPEFLMENYESELRLFEKLSWQEDRRRPEHPAMSTLLNFKAPMEFPDEGAAQNFIDRLREEGLFPEDRLIIVPANAPTGVPA